MSDTPTLDNAPPPSFMNGPEGPDGKFSKIYRLGMVLFVTSVFCYLVRYILYLVFHLVIPIVVLVVAYVFYVNRGWASSDGYHNSMDSLTSAVSAFMSGIWDIGEGIKNIITQ